MDFMKCRKECDNIKSYNSFLKSKIEDSMAMPNKKKYKLETREVKIPSLSEHIFVIKYNYNISQLKNITSFYNLKKTGNKTQLIFRIYSFLYYSYYIIKIQKVFKGYLQRYFNFLKGPALFKKKICHNPEDFASFEEIKNIHYDQFYSYEDEDGFIYGFDLISIYNLFSKNNINLHDKRVIKIIEQNYSYYNDDISIENPYNRNRLSSMVLKRLNLIFKLSKVLKRNIDLNFENEIEIPIEKAVEFRCIKLFQTIDNLGNYSNHNWFYNLSHRKLIKFTRELFDIWNYRAQLSSETKRNILPPHGHLYINPEFAFIDNIYVLKNTILEIIEKLVYTGVNTDSRYLGASYILSALTLVDNEASIALPWLYYSVYHN